MKSNTAIPTRAEAQLTEEEYRVLLATSTDAVLITDEHGTIRYANPAVLDIFGYAPGELIGNQITMIQPERLREDHRRGLKSFLENGRKKLDWRSTETFGLRRGGHEFPIEISFSHLSHERNVFAAFIRDITERRQLEQAVKESEARYRALIENFPSGNITAFDRDLRLTFVGGQDVKKLGGPEMFVGKLLAEVAPAETCAVVEPSLQRAFAGKTVTYETPVSFCSVMFAAATITSRSGVAVARAEKRCARARSVFVYWPRSPMTRSGIGI